MAAAAVQAIKRNARADDALFVFPHFTSYLNQYNSAVNEKNRLGGNTALQVTEFVIRNYGDQAQLLDQQEGFRRRYQARISKIMKSAVTDRQREILDERLDMGLRRKQLHTREQTGTKLWQDHVDCGSVTRERILMRRHRTIPSWAFATLMRSALPIHDPHGLKLQHWHDNILCGYVFAAGGYCTEKEYLSLDHSKVRCRGKRGARKHNSGRDAIVRIANELHCPATPNATIPGSAEHPDLKISLLFLADVLVDFANVDSELGPEGTTSFSKMQSKWEEKCRKYNQLCYENGMLFLPCVTSALGGFSSQTVQLLVQPLARILAQREWISISQASDRIMLTIQSAFMMQIARNARDFMNRHGFRMPDVVELKNQCPGIGSGRI
jgi:hypothetical protein